MVHDADGASTVPDADGASTAPDADGASTAPDADGASTASGADPRSQRERMLAGALYQADDAELVALARRAAVLVQRYNTTDADNPEQHAALLRELLGRVGDKVVVRPPFYCDYGSQIRIGDRSYLNFNAVLLDVAPIDIGADVQIGPNVQLLTPHHPLAPEPRRARWEAGKPITIGDNVWLGGGVIVLGGVTIGPDTVVGAGSVVTGDLPPGVLALGTPARVHGPLPPH